MGLDVVEPVCQDHRREAKLDLTSRNELVRFIPIRQLKYFGSDALEPQTAAERHDVLRQRYARAGDLWIFFSWSPLYLTMDPALTRFDAGHMHLHMLSKTVILFSVLLGVATASPLASTQARRVFNETRHLLAQTFSNGSLPLALGFVNTNVSTATTLLNGNFKPPQNFLPYNVPRSPVTILFHGFGLEIGLEEVLQTITGAITIAFGYVVDSRGSEPIANGYLSYKHSFHNKHEVEFAVGDFREVGRPMTYYVLADVLRGIWDFMMLPEQKFTEVRFEIEQTGVGYVGSGFIERLVEVPTQARGLK